METAKLQTPTPVDVGNALALASFEEQTTDLLKRLGLKAELAEQIKLRLQSDADGLSPFELVGQLAEALKGIKTKPKKPHPKRRKAAFDPDDLRQIVRDGTYEGLDAYASLYRAGHIRPLADDFK